MINHHHRILVDSNNLKLTKEQQHYLYKVLRLKVGDMFYVTDGNNKQALAVLEGNENFRIVESWKDTNVEPNINIKLYVALFKFEAFEWVIDKAVELGVSSIVPFYSKNSIKSSVSALKLERWNKIAISSMLQCGSCKKVEVLKPINFDQIPDLTNISASNKSESIMDKTPGIGIVLHEKLKKISLLASYEFISEISRSTNNILLASGPEGGFTEDEIEQFIAKNWKIIWLGPRRYKAETAPIVAISKIVSF